MHFQGSNSCNEDDLDLYEIKLNLIQNQCVLLFELTAFGTIPEARHLILKNFSIPISEPKPASVRTYPSFPTNFKAIMSARIELQPCAILAKGPA